MKKLFITAVILLFIGASELAAQSYKVIVNEANTIESITKKDLSDIFLKKTSKWDDGTAITPIDLGTRSTTRAAFSIDVHGQSIGAIRSYWQQAAFSGAGTAPLERSSDADVIAFVQSYPGAVGYISDSADAAGVKVLDIK
ncbi:substrate-binding domain-containing protein [Gracilimonas sp.]|uniref:substrate-binding domain-containing protein n=1 Tax=Gracilimonas sp. TaxID=1974203 RepID=UPI0032ED1EA4